jgi:hypothetical protein
MRSMASRIATVRAAFRFVRGLMRGGPLRPATCAVLVLACSAPAYAQTADRPVRRVEVSAGGAWFGGAGLGAEDANLRANASPAQPLRLFATDTRMSGAAALQAEVGFFFNRRWGVEGSFLKSAPELRSSISADAEAAPPLTVVERVDQYVIGGHVVFMLDEVRLGQRTIPFVTAGAGYLRQLHESHMLVDEGVAYYGGGGLKYWLFARARGLFRAAGVRVDGRLYLLTEGIMFEDGPRPHGAISGSAFVMF